jgi:esterase/lipase superfamily enzyme
VQLRSVVGLAFVGWVTTLAYSCREPATRITPNPAAATIYDPEQAAALEKRFPAMKAANDRYRTALAVPVSVIAWEDDHSVSRIFFATNRTVVAAPTAAAPATIGNAWGAALAVGTCEVTLPRAVRGTAPDGNVVVAAARPLPADRFYGDVRAAVDRAAEHDVLLFVHGFQVSFDAAMSRAAQLGIDLPFNGAVIAYSWPSQGGIRNYSADEQVVAASVEPFVHFLDDLDRALPSSTNLHIVVHSMGNRLVLAGLSRLPERFAHPPRFANLVLAAPDVGVDDFRRLGPQAIRTARRTSLYVCDSDTALIASKGLHNMQRIGDALPPVIVPGIETIDASAIETSFMGHSYYGSNRSALSDLFALIKENRPAAERGWLRANSSPEGTWWSVASTPTEVRCVWHFRDLKSSAAEQNAEQSTEHSAQQAADARGGGVVPR